MNSVRKFILIVLLFSLYSKNIEAQALTSNFGNYTGCTGSIRLFNFDFTATTSNTVTLADLSISNGGDNECCAESGGCLFFNVTIDPNSVGIVFSLTGAGGTILIFYDNCSATYNANTNICLNSANAYIDPVTGATFHRFMFCRTGNTTYDFTFTQLLAPEASPDIITTGSCTKELLVTGLTSPVWTSTSPGAVGAYNANLSCTSCANPVFTPSASTLNTTITYSVSGTITSPCVAAIPWSDVVLITNSPLIVASAQTVCVGSTASLTASTTQSSGTTYQWQSSTTSSTSGFANATGTFTNSAYSANVSVNTWYNSVISLTGCPSFTTAAVLVSTIPALAGTVTNAQTICSGSSATTLTVTPSGGTGSYAYQWQSSTTSSTSGFAIAAGTSTVSTYVLGTLTNTTTYSVSHISNGWDWINVYSYCCRSKSSTTLNRACSGNDSIIPGGGNGSSSVG